MYVVYKDELKHHGIKGQKWGVKNGPPYPLPEEKASKVRMKSEYSYHKERHFNKKELSSSKYSGPSELSKLKRITKHDNVKEILKNVCSDIRQWDLFNCQNCSVAFDMIRRGYNVKAKPRREGSNVGDIEKFYDGAKLEKVGVSNSDPGFKKYKELYDEIELKGFELDAFYENHWSELRPLQDKGEEERSKNKTWQEYSTLFDEWEQAGSDAQDVANELYFKAINNTTNKIKSFGPNSRGTIVVGWDASDDYSKKTNEFHAFNFECVNGELKFYDTQSRREEKSTGTNFIDGIVDGMDPRELFVMRTDDKELSDKFSEAVY